MTEEKPLSDIKKELYEVLADKTLSFGCEVKYEDKCGVHTRVIGEYAGSENLVMGSHNNAIGFYARCGTFCNALDFITDKVKIIGHEPTLNDVLLELGEKYDAVCSTLSDDRHHHMIQIKDFDDKLFKNFYYSTSGDFDNQSEETLRKLHTLLT